MNLGVYITRRVLNSVPLLIGVSILLFAVLRLAPGDPTDIYADIPGVSAQVIDNLRRELGLDQPLPLQYVHWLGAAGSGQATKATNQIMCAGIIRACAEAMAFAGAHNLPLERVVSTLGAGAGSSWYFVHRAPNMVRGAYPAGFRVRLHAKDLGICRDMAARMGVSLPVVDSMLAEYAQLIAQGFGDEDISATHRLKQALFRDAAGKT